MKPRTVATAVGYESAATVATAVMGLARGVILARLLVPEIFGVAALAMVFVQVTFSLTNPHLGFEYLRERGEVATDDGVLKRLTYRVGGLRLALFLCLVPLSGYLYPDYALLAPLLAVFAASRILDSIVQVEMFRMRRALKFRNMAVLNIASSAFITILAPAVALAGGGVWALAAEPLGGLAMRGALVYGRFRIPSERATPARADTKRFLDTGREMWLGGNLREAIERSDDLLVGTFLGSTALGLYSKAFELGGSFSSVLQRPFGSALMPIWTQLREDRAALSQSLYRVFYVLLRLTMAASCVLLLFAPELVRGVLGANWTPMIPALRIFVVAAGIKAMASVLSSAALMLGSPRDLRVRRTIQASLAIPLFTASAVAGNITLMAGAVLIAQVIFMAMLIPYLKRYVDLSFVGLSALPVAVLLFSGLLALSLESGWWNPGPLLGVKFFLGLVLPLLLASLVERRELVKGVTELRGYLARGR